MLNNSLVANNNEKNKCLIPFPLINEHFVYPGRHCKTHTYNKGLLGPMNLCYMSCCSINHSVLIHINGFLLCQEKDMQRVKSGEGMS